MGVYQLVLPAYSVLSSFCITGLTMATSRLCALHTANRNHRASYKVVSVSVKIFLILFTLTATVILSFSRFISAGVLGDARTRLSLFILLPCLLFTGIENILKNYFFGTSRLKPPIISELTEQIVRFIAVIALLFIFSPRDASKSSALIICGMVISEVISVIILTRFYGVKKPDATPVLKSIGEIAIPVALSAVFNTILSAANSVLIPNRLIAYGYSRNGAISTFGVLFGMTIPTVCLPFGIIGALITVIIPKMSEHTGNLTYLRRKAGKIIHTTSLIALPALCVLVVFGEKICKIMYANPDAGAYVLPLSIAVLFSFYHMSFTAILNAVGLQRRAAIISVVGGLIQLAGTYLVGCKGIGIYGFLAGDVLSAIFCALFSCVPIIKLLRLRISMANWFLRPALASLSAIFSARYVFLVAIKGGISANFALIPALAIFLLCYLLTLRVLGTSFITYLKKLQS